MWTCSTSSICTCRCGARAQARARRASRRARGRSRPQLLHEVVECSADGGEPLELLHRQVDIELFLERHRYLDQVETVGPCLLESCIARELLHVNPELPRSDL